MKRRVVSLGLIMALMSMFTLMPVSTASAQKGGKGSGGGSAATTFPVTGTGTTSTGIPVTFTGNFYIQKFEVLDGAIKAIGTLSGTTTNTATGAVLQTVSNLQQTITLINATANAACEILRLELGPLDLNLLGLEVHLDRIELVITAQPGEGNLLGNLLCAIAGLLDPDDGVDVPLAIIADLLNSLLDLLNFLR